MATYSLLVTASPYSSQGQLSAIQFAKTLLEQGHELMRVFFYADGVLVASRLHAPPADEINLTKAWAKLAIEKDIELIACVTAANKRGIVNVAEAERNALTGNNLDPAFEISGLGQLTEAMLNSDRLVTFG
ncbi:sulfurtransferase complex subunit TusD [Kangiella koreensis]|uniref:Sulfur relay protein TusD/DsrE n=1 Tax=Kangiella koreensis (strain DSM 16069 / JCM 12317 / KCTC 12182 / SW-125) TaxID=523791 RepID=C7RCJ6_KANKD|nr:sulfurtransferase complex subunit TusD [Kangiella koreensis]ACV26988.1 sulfur relay protein TusD/DsrE [Kangiella koreensis DSM 16069]